MFDRQVADAAAGVQTIRLRPAPRSGRHRGIFDNPRKDRFLAAGRRPASHWSRGPPGRTNSPAADSGGRVLPNAEAGQLGELRSSRARCPPRPAPPLRASGGGGNRPTPASGGGPRRGSPPPGIAGDGPLLERGLFGPRGRRDVPRPPIGDGQHQQAVAPGRTCRGCPQAPAQPPLSAFRRQTRR